jgi:arylsulfatase A-like enzyme
MLKRQNTASSPASGKKLWGRALTFDISKNPSRSQSRREFLRTVGLGASALALSRFPACRTRTTAYPNIVYIIADDMGYGDLSCLNPECKIPTPHMDRLASEGMIFTDAHSGSAVCTPTRYGILTGRYSWRTRLESGVLWGYSRALIPRTRMTVASLLKQHGYATACVGKWHLGWDWATTDGYIFSDRSDEKGESVDYSQPISGGPLDLGFDYYFGIPASLDMLPYVYVENDRVVAAPTETITGTQGRRFYRGGPIAPGFKHEEVLPECTAKALAFVDNHAKTSSDAPFFLYFPLNAPHTPILPTEEFQGKSGIGPYGDFVMQCDDTIGQVMRALECHNMTDNTLFVVTSDNGCSPMADFEDLARQGHHPSYHFRGYKADIYEGGHRIPFIVRWPAKIQPGRECDDTICLTDLMATAADILDYDLPDNAGEDSISILPDLFGGATAPVREATVHHSINGSFSIRQGKWKLEYCPGSGGWSYPRPKEAVELDLPGFQLYDLDKDIGEQNNVMDKHPDVIENLTELMAKYVNDGRSTPGLPQKNDRSVSFLFR